MLESEHTDADALGLYLTGASSDGGVQTDPDLSLGNYRSSSRVELLGVFITNSIPGIIIDRVGSANGVGLGSLEAIDGNKLRWTAPGDTPGATVPIVNGKTRMLQSGSDPAKFIVVTCHTANLLFGRASVNLVPVFNNAVGMSNVPSEDSQDKLRCIAMKNNNPNYTIKHLKVWVSTLATQRVSDAGQLGASGAGTIEITGSFFDWPDTGFCRITTSAGNLREIVYYSERTDTELTVPAAGRGQLETSASAGAATDTLDAVPGIKIAKEAPVADAFTEASDEHDTAAVSGLSWTTGIEKDSGLVITALETGEMVGIWLWMAVVSGRIASPLMKNLIKRQFSLYNIEVFG